MRDRGKSSSHTRGAIAQFAAQLLMADGELSFGAARRKAAARMGGARGHELPDHAEIESALRENQRIFAGPAQQQHVLALRREALSAMQFLAPFDPLLVGPVLTGTAGPHARITLHLFADTAEEIMGFLAERSIPGILGERRYQEAGACPTVSFLAGQTRIELVVFPLARRHQAPMSELNGRPMPRAATVAVRALIEESPLPAQLPL